MELKEFYKWFEKMCECARFNLIKDGRLVPVLLTVNNDRIVVNDLRKVDKEDYWKVKEVVKEKLHPEAYIHISEAWAVMGDEALKTKTRPSEHPNKVEIMIIAGAFKGGTKLAYAVEFKKVDDKIVFGKEHKMQVGVDQVDMEFNLWEGIFNE